MSDKTSEVPRLTPNNISDVGLQDVDSGLRLFRGMMSPWDQIKSFKETYKFLIRHAATIAVGYMHATRIVEPDYDKMQTALSDSWAQMMDYAWQPDSDSTKMFEEEFDVPPFWKKGVVRSALYADKGDNQMLIPGHIWYTTNDRFEKEIHGCMFDIAGPEACDLSLGGGSHFCQGLAQEPLNGYDPERIGCGDNYCLAVQENGLKYGHNANANPDGSFGPGHREWEGWGPTGGGERPEGMPHKEENEFLTTGFFESPTGARWTAGQMYKDCNMWPLAYSYIAIDVFRNLDDDAKQELASNAVKVIFEAMGKAEFVDATARKAARDWMGVPADVDDSRVMAGWISMVMQARSCEWKFTKFEPDESTIEVGTTQLYMMGMYPEFLDAYRALFNGNVKTLVGAKWTVDAEEDEDEEGNDVARFTIHQRAYGYREQKPNLDNYDK